MKVILKKHICIVKKEKGDKNIKGGVVNAAGESLLLYKVKNILNKKACEYDKYNVIKNRKK